MKKRPPARAFAAAPGSVQLSRTSSVAAPPSALVTSARTLFTLRRSRFQWTLRHPSQGAGMLRRAVAAAVLTVALAFPLPAQLPDVQPGVRVRVEAPTIVKGKFAATVLSRTADTLVLGRGSVLPIHIPLGLISSLEISRGTSHADGARRGMKWGASILVAAVGLSAIQQDRPACSTTGPKLWNEDCGPLTVGDVVGGVAVSMLVGGMFGAGIGALIGRERWDSLDLRRHTSLHFDRGRVGLHVGF